MIWILIYFGAIAINAILFRLFKKDWKQHRGDYLMLSLLSFMATPCILIGLVVEYLETLNEA